MEGTRIDPAEGNNLEDPEKYGWEDIAAAAGLHAASNADRQEACRQLIRDVLMHELNTNETYQKYCHAQQQESQHKADIMTCYQTSPAWLGQPYGAWRRSKVCSETYMMLTYPEHSKVAWGIACLINLAIMWSTAMFCVATVPSIQSSDHLSWINATEYACLAIFTVEFTGRLLTCPRLTPFLLSFMNWLDAVAIIPPYIELIMGAAGEDSSGLSRTRVVRLIRLLRMLRLLRLWNRLHHLVLVLDALVKSMNLLATMGCLLGLLLVVFASLIYFLENDTNPGLDSIPQAMYFIHTTVTTTGYGEITPLTWQGRALTGVCMLFAIITLALPISVIGGNFSSMLSDYRDTHEAATRNEQVWPGLQRLRSLLARHHKIAAGVLNSVHEVQASILTELVALREEGWQVRLLYLIMTTEGKTGDWESDCQEMQSLTASMRSRMERLRTLQEELRVLTATCDASFCGRLMPLLDKLQSAQKTLMRWENEAGQVQQEVTSIIKEVDAVRTQHGKHKPVLSHN